MFEKERKESSEFIIDFFYRTLIGRMEREIAEKRNATENFRLGWDGAIRGEQH